MATALTFKNEGAHNDESTHNDAHAAHEPQKETITIDHKSGPLVMDIWYPGHPTTALPILLIHGWGGTGSYWEKTARALGATNHVVVPDLPGTGRSQPVRRPQDMFDQVATLADILHQLKLDRVQIVGHSMGSAMGLLLADAHPDKVDRLVMTSMCFFLNEAQEKVYHSIMKFMHLTMRFRPDFLSSIPGVSRLMGMRYFYRFPDDPAILQQGLKDYLELDYETAVACADDACSPKIPKAGGRIQAPVLLVACRQDQVMPVENVDYTAGIIPDCQVRWLDRCGHLPMVEKPDEYLAILQEFLQLGE